MTTATELPLITVLTACRRAHPGFLREALESIVRQSSPRWRALVIVDDDDASSASQAGGLLNNLGDDRFLLVRQPSRGFTKALNEGMRAARTPYVCHLLSDDLLADNAIEVLEQYILRFPEVDFFHSSRQIIGASGEPISGIYPASASFTLEDFKRRGPVKHLHCWKVASALAIGGMDENRGPHGADDYDFPWSMAESGCRFQAVEECLYYYRDHREGYRLTTHVPLDEQIAELRAIWRKHGVTAEEMERMLQARTSGYLRQALYTDEADRARKEAEGYDIRSGWRLPGE